MAKSASWSIKDLRQAIRMKRQGATCAVIAAALGRGVVAVEAKLNWSGTIPVKNAVPRPMESVPIRANEEQIERSDAPHRDLTGIICGDPAIGYSALDRKRGATPIATLGSE
jgi:hypothetical protein